MNQTFFQRHSWKILIATAFLIPLILGGSRRAIMTNTNDVKQWLPASFKETTEYRWFRGHFENEQFVLVSWEGCTLDDERLELMARKLAPEAEVDLGEGNPRYFKTALTGTRLLNQLTSEPTNLSEEEARQRLSGLLIGPDGQQTCLILSLTEQAKAKPRATLDYLLSVAENECALTRADIRMGGPPVDNVAIDVEGERTLYRLAGLSAFVGLVVSWWCLRSYRLTLIVFLASLISAGISLSLVWYSGEKMNAVLLTMPSLVYVLTLSGAIHIVNYYRDAIHEHGWANATASAIQKAWAPCTLAAVTTAVGLGSLYISDLIPIQLFGLYSALGVLATLFVLFLFVPAMVYLWPDPADMNTASVPKQHSPRNVRWNTRWSGVAELILNHNVAVSLVCVAVMVFFAVGVQRVKTSVKLMKLFSPEAEIIAHYGWLEEHLGPLVPMEVVLKIDNDRCSLSFLERMRLAQAVKDSVKQLPDVGAAWSTATFAPEAPVQEKGPQRGIGGALVRVLGDRQQLSDNVFNRRLLAHRDEFLNGDFFAQEGDTELWRVSARAAALTDLDYGKFVDQIRTKVEPILAAQREAGVDGIEVIYTGLVPLVYKAQHSLLEGLIYSFMMAFVLIAIVMMFVLRGVSAGLLSMIPNIFPAVIIFGIMGWGGILVDIGSMMCASVALGVAVDDTVHFMTWFRRGLLRGLDRRGAVMNAYRHCAGAMLQTTAIAGLGMAMFSFSTFTPTQRFGYLMLTLLVAALVGDLLLLPAMLVGPLGRFFSGKLEKKETELGTPRREPAPHPALPHVSDAPRVGELPRAGRPRAPANWSV